jgi:DNA adenine methylase
MAAVAPKRAFASDSFEPLIEIFQTLKSNPHELVGWYRKRLDLVRELGVDEAYLRVRDSFNKNPNGPDFVFLSRSCWGGVIRFRQADGYMSTPVGRHKLMEADSFAVIAEDWNRRVHNVNFRVCDYRKALSQVRKGDFVYCDPPYGDSQTILYGSHAFNLPDLLERIAWLKQKGAYVAMSYDGNRKTGRLVKMQDMVDGIFEREVLFARRKSQLMRFQSEGGSMERLIDSERLLLTY